MAFVVRSASSVSTAQARPVVKINNTRMRVVSRAVDKEPTPAPEQAPEVPPFAEVRSETPPPPVTPSGGNQVFKAPFGSVMDFGGKAPEITNGRLAMLGFIAALGAELATGEWVFAQLQDAPIFIPATFALFIVASIIPMNKNKKAESVGPLTPDAELVNGRAAMIGFAALLAIEAIKGDALF